MNIESNLLQRYKLSSLIKELNIIDKGWRQLNSILLCMSCKLSQVYKSDSLYLNKGGS